MPSTNFTNYLMVTIRNHSYAIEIVIKWNNAATGKPSFIASWMPTWQICDFLSSFKTL